MSGCLLAADANAIHVEGAQACRTETSCIDCTPPRRCQGLCLDRSESLRPWPQRRHRARCNGRLQQFLG
eukprot:3250200-Amphidinium_carterae.1